MIDNPPQVVALIRFGMNSPNVRCLLEFYEQALSACVQPFERPDDSLVAPDGIGGSASSTLMKLGNSTVELLEFDTPGRPYPHDLSPYDSRFQHLGVIVTDMHRAMERLSQSHGWSAISTGGPQTLPDEDGGVTAFKFRDPDGHPLELLQFAAGRIPVNWRDPGGGSVHLGIDHSALSVTDVARSVRFYEAIGLCAANRTVNRGGPQQRMDGVTAPVVDVVSLLPRRSMPHVELLHYRTALRPTHDAPAVNDTAATRLVFAVQRTSVGKANQILQDPDGHFLKFESSGQL